MSRGRTWAEPGLGDVELAVFLAAFPADFTGDYLIESTCRHCRCAECHQVTYDRAVEALPLGTRS